MLVCLGFGMRRLRLGDIIYCLQGQSITLPIGYRFVFRNIRAITSGQHKVSRPASCTSLKDDRTRGQGREQRWRQRLDKASGAEGPPEPRNPVHKWACDAYPAAHSACRASY